MYESEPKMSDWRLDNLKRLRGVSFRFAAYKKPRDEWDHGHWEGCWAKFAELEGADILHEGFLYSELAGLGVSDQPLAWKVCACFQPQA